MQTIEFTIPQPTPLLNQLLRKSHQQRRRENRALAMEVLAAMSRTGQRRPRQPFARCQIHVVRGSSGLPDWDGLYGGLKPLLDTLVRPSARNPHGLGLIEDDNPLCVVSLRAEPEKASPGSGYTRVVIAEVVE